MGKRGPKKRPLFPLEKKPSIYPVPVVGMHETARKVWKRIVHQYPVGHFKPQHFDLLRIYSESAAVNKLAMKRYVESDYEDVRWLSIADKMASRCQGLSVKLGINVNSTIATRGRPGYPAEVKSKRDGLLFGGKK